MKNLLSSLDRIVYDSDRGDLRKVRVQTDQEANASEHRKLKRVQRVRVVLDTKQRRGKNVTIIQGIQHNPQVIDELATMLKRFCGAGGTVKGKDIEIQGDHRQKIIAKLKELGYEVLK